MFYTFCIIVVLTKKSPTSMCKKLEAVCWQKIIQIKGKQLIIYNIISCIFIVL